jgi:N-methylhydantoinase A/oxoprolinase/acetone carboxylase beta subunit
VVEIGGVRTLFRMPDLYSIGLGGGSIVRNAGVPPAGGRDGRGPIAVGPESVGYRLTREALVFGGGIVTATDAAVKAGVVEIGDAGRLGELPRETADGVIALATAMLEDAIDRMKTEAGDVTLIAVGGGAFLVPDRLQGIGEVIRVAHGDCANAVGAAVAQVSGETDQIYRDMTRAEAIAAAEAQAVERATASGADPATIQTIEIEDMPLAYLPGNALRVRVRVAGEMTGA